MAFKVGDRVRVLETALEGNMRGCRGNVFEVVALGQRDEGMPYRLSDGTTSEWFGDNEIEAADPQPVAPPAQTHDYMLGYAAGFTYHAEFDYVQPNYTADFGAGFLDGYDRQQADRRAAITARLAEIRH